MEERIEFTKKILNIQKNLLDILNLTKNKIKVNDFYFFGHNIVYNPFIAKCEELLKKFEKKKEETMLLNLKYLTTKSDNSKK